MKGNFYLIYLAWPERCFRLTPEDLAFLRKRVPKASHLVAVWDDASFLKALPQATHVFTWHFKRTWFDRAPRLRILATPAAGRELVPTEGPENVRIHHGHFHGEIMSETVLAFLLAWTHGFFQVRADPLWPRAALSTRVTRDLAGSRAVLLGYGRIGRAIARRLATFGVTVFGYSRHLRIPPRVFARELGRADWLITALPSDTGTDDLVNAELLAKVPASCVFVNVGRGNCVDEKALLSALREGRLAGAYLDVFKNEPTVLAKESCKPTRGETDLANLPARSCPWNLIRMPHAAAYTPAYLRRFFEELGAEDCL